jgi:hypothetical protein
MTQFLAEPGLLAQDSLEAGGFEAKNSFIHSNVFADQSVLDMSPFQGSLHFLTGRIGYNVPG